jgi:hypothetical protein
VFAPGHFGELTRLIPFEMVDDVLNMTGAEQSRVRLLPARVTVYLLLAGCLFAEVGYRQVWQRLTAGLTGLNVANPAGSALRQARQRLGVAPLRALFDLLRRPGRHDSRRRGALAGPADLCDRRNPADSRGQHAQYRPLPQNTG